MELLKKSPQPLPITLANWDPKKNAEDETRVRVDFELPLTDEVLEYCHKSIKAVAQSISVFENGLTEGKINLEFLLTIELFTTPGHTVPAQTLSAVPVNSLFVFRPIEKEGSRKELYLQFSTTVRAEGPFGQALVAWLLPALKSTVFIRMHEVQGTLPGMGEEAAADDKERKPARKSGKDAAAGKDVN
jgi:hypothetical protein